MTADTQIITVTYCDDVAIQAADIGTGDLTVFGPNGYAQVAVLESIRQGNNPGLITATYSITAPGGTWDNADLGAYAIYLGDMEVTDGTNAIPGGQIGSFIVETISTPRDGFSYRATQVPFEFIDISATGATILTNVDDQAFELTDVALGDFQFPFYGTTYRSVFVNSNGILTFGGPDTTFTNDELFFQTDPTIAAFWDDLVTNAAGIQWQVIGSGNEQSLIVQWGNVEYISGGGTITFQAILEEKDGVIKFNYLDIEDPTTFTQNNGISATIGFRDTDITGGYYHLVSFNEGLNDFVGNQKSLRIERDFDGRWMPLGPFTASNGQTENLSPDNQVVGAIHTLLAHPTNPEILWAGSVNGGVWRTDNAQSANPTWQNLTDSERSQSIGALAFDLADPTGETVYAGIGRFSSYGRIGGARTGLLRTTDGGETWEEVGGLAGRNISGIHANGNTVVVSVNVADSFSFPNIGIFRSTDGGATFTQISQGNGSATGLPGGVSYDLFTNPVNPAVIYSSTVFSENVGGLSGVYQSTDEGATWSRVSSAAMNALIGNGTSNLELAVGRSGEVYAAIINGGALSGLFRSGDAGATWTQMDTPQTNENGTDVGLNPSGGKGPGAGSPIDEIAGGQGAIHFSIVADPTDPNIVYVGGDRQPLEFQNPTSVGARDFSGRLFRGNASLAAGSQWVHLTHSNVLGAAGGGTQSSSAPHADSREMVFDAAGNLIEADDGGVYRRTLPRTNIGDWFGISGNMQVTEAHDVAWDSVSNVAISGNQDTGTTQQSAPGNSIWTSIHTGDGGDVLVVESGNTSARYSSFQNLGGFRRTTYDASGNQTGVNFPALTVTTGSPLSRAFRTPVAANPVTGALYIQGTNGIYESLNNGATIAQLTTSGPSAGVSGLAQNAIIAGGELNGVRDNDILWVGAGNNVLLRSAAGGILNQVSSPLTNSTILDLAVSDTDWRQAFVIDNNQVTMTTNAGASWTDITGNLNSLANTFGSVVYISTPLFNALVVGTDSGTYMTPLDSYGTTGEWKKLGADLPNVLQFEMEYDADDDVLLVGTMGRGAWLLNDVQETVMETLLDFDYGDAPASFLIRRSQDGGRHVAQGVTLGARRDFEADGIPTPDASGDDGNNETDDEDGVIFLTPVGAGRTTQVRVNVSEDAFLSVLVDLDLNGQWDDAGGEVISRQAVFAGDNDLSFSLPPDITSVPVTSWIRFLVTTDPLAGNHSGGARDGEVEDYQVTIQAGRIVQLSLDSATMSENGGVVTGTVTLSEPDFINDSVVLLTSNDLTEATVTASVTIPAGETTGTFTVTAVDDNLLDGTQIVQLTGTLANAQAGTVDVSVTDFETLSVSIGVPEVAENAGPNARTGTVTRNNTDLGSAVTVQLLSSDTTELTTPVSVTIPAGSASATFQMNAVDDLTADGTISVTVSARGQGYIGTATANVAVLDDESSMILVSQTDGFTRVSETGTTDTVLVSLSQRPLGDVVISVFAGSPTEFSVAPTSVTIPAASWNVPVPVVVTGLDDVFVDGTRTASLLFSVNVAQSAILFSSAPEVSITMENEDNEIAGLLITETDGNTVLTETPGVDTVLVRLIDRPQSTVVFSVSVSDSTEATVVPSVLSFTSTNWNIPQVVTLNSSDDNLVDGDILSQLVFSVRPASSNDLFDTLPDRSVSILTLDNEVPGFSVTQTGGSTTVSEDGTTDNVLVRLLAAPVSDVVFSVTTTDPGEATASPATLTFTTANWNVGQTVTITGTDDLLFDKTQTSQLVIKIDAASSQDAFDSLPASILTITTLDNEPDPPTITGPAIDTRTSFPTFTWTPVPGAVSYDIWVGSFLIPEGPVINTTVTGTSYTSPVLLDLGRHRVWVRANLSTGITTAWSFPRTFDVRTPAVIQPLARFQETYRPQISWTPVPNATSYQIQIDSRFTAPFGLVFESGLTSTTYNLTTDLPLGLYRVWVRAMNANGQLSAWSNPREFYIAVAPTATAPPESTFDSTPTFRWNPVLGGREYRIRVFNTVTRQVVLDRDGIQDLEFTSPVELQPGLHRWNVQAKGENDVIGLWSTGNLLTVGGRTQITSPAGTQSSNQPLFQWGAVEGVFTYSIYIVGTGGTSGLITADNLTTNSFSPASPMAAGTYRVWVRAVSTTGQFSPWSLPIDITITGVMGDGEPESSGPEFAKLLPLIDHNPLTVTVFSTDELTVSSHKAVPPVKVSADVEQVTDRRLAILSNNKFVQALPREFFAMQRWGSDDFATESSSERLMPAADLWMSKNSEEDGEISSDLDLVLADWDRMSW